MNIDLSNVPLFQSLLPSVRQITRGRKAEVYLVGGAVRDILLHSPLRDMDLVVFSDDYAAFAAELGKKLRAPAIAFKDNIRIPYKNGDIDVSAPRGADIHEDLQKRDFTINNLAIDLDGRLIGDPRDIVNKQIIPVYAQAFDDDPVRILRGFRLAAALDFTLSPEFLALAGQKSFLLPNTAAERIYHELELLAQAPPAGEIYRKMTGTGVWDAVLGYVPSAEAMEQALFRAEKNRYDAHRRFCFFLAAALIHYDGDPKKLLKTISAAGQVTRKTLWLLHTSGALQAAEGNLSETKRILWRSHQKGDSCFLFDFMRVRYGKEDDGIQIYLDLEEQIDDSLSEVIGGSVLLDIAHSHAPNLNEGPWIAELLEEVKIALAFHELEDRSAAEAYIRAALKKRG